MEFVYELPGDKDRYEKFRFSKSEFIIGFMKRLLVFLFAFLMLTACNSSKKMQKDIAQFSAEDEKIFTDVQRTTFQYFWDGAEPTSGLARERFHMDDVYPQNDKMIVTSGG